MAVQKIDVYLTLRRLDNKKIQVYQAASTPPTPPSTAIASNARANSKIVHFIVEMDDEVFDDVIETDVVFNVGHHAVDSGPVVAQLRKIAKDLS